MPRSASTQWATAPPLGAWIRRIDLFTLIGAVPVVLMSLAIIALTATVLAQSFIPQTGAHGGLTLANFVSVFSDPQTYLVLLNSVEFATTALLVAFGFGLPMAWLVESSDLKGKGIALTLVSARISGAPTWGIVRRIVLPPMSRGLLLAWLYIVILTARELTMSVLLSTPGNMTLPVVIWSLWLNGGSGQASAAIVCFLVLVLPLMAIYAAMLQRGREAAAAARTLATDAALAVGPVR